MTSMRLLLTVPGEVLVDTPVRKVTAEARDGWFCLLPRHVDVVTALVPGLLVYEGEDGVEAFVAVDDGVLVKCGADVLVSAQRAVTGAALGRLEHGVATALRVRDERERQTRAAMRRLEAAFLRGLVDLEEVRRG